MKKSDRRLPAMDEETRQVLADAARKFPTVDPRLFAGVGDAVREYQAINLGNFEAINKSMKTFEALRPIVAPQIPAAIAESLKGVVVPPAPSIANAFESWRPTFAYLKTLDDVGSVVKPVVSDAMRAWTLPPDVATAVSDALGSATTGIVPPLPSLAAVAVSSAVTFSHAPEVAEAASQSLADVDLDALAPWQRIELESKMINAITALGIVVAILAHNDRIELASAMLALLAILVSIYGDVSK